MNYVLVKLVHSGVVTSVLMKNLLEQANFGALTLAQMDNIVIISAVTLAQINNVLVQQIRFGVVVLDQIKNL
jgi:hypothetical protein